MRSDWPRVTLMKLSVESNYFYLTAFRYVAPQNITANFCNETLRTNIATECSIIPARITTETRPQTSIYGIFRDFFYCNTYIVPMMQRSFQCFLNYEYMYIIQIVRRIHQNYCIHFVYWKVVFYTFYCCFTNIDYLDFCNFQHFSPLIYVHIIINIFRRIHQNFSTFV